MLKKQLLVWAIILCFCKLNAQSIILVSNGGGIYSLDINSVSCTTQLINNFGCGGSPFSAALFKDTLYYVSFDPTTHAPTLFQSILNNNSYCKKFKIDNIPNNLTVDSAGIVYWQGADAPVELFSFNPHTGALINHGQMNYASSGDLIFYNGKLFLASEGLVEVNVQKPEDSKIYMSTGNHSFYGLINIPVGCNKNQVFGIETKGTGESDLIEIDMENKKIGSIFCTIPFDVYDAASITETGIVKGISVASLQVHPDCGINGHSGSININAVSASPGVINIYLNGKATDNTGVFKNLLPGNYNFHIVSSEGCTIDTIINIVQSAQLNFSVKTLPDTCSAGKGIIFINPLGNYGALTYYLNDEIQPSNIYNNLQSNTYKNKC